MPHVFQMFALWLPEAKMAYRHMAKFVSMVEKDGLLNHNGTSL